MTDTTPGTTDDEVQRLPEELAALAGGRALVLRLVRHAETVYNTQHVMQGWSDSPITDLGHQQIAGVAERLSAERFDLAFSSDLPRTRTTAEGILGALDPQPPVEYLESLREWHFGSHEERPSFDVWSEVIAAEGLEVDRELSALRTIAERVGWSGLFDAVAASDGTGQAEQAAAIVLRADAALAHVVRAAAALPGDEEAQVLVVSHGGFISSLLRQLVPDVAPDVILANCSVTTVALSAGSTEWELRGIGETA